MYPLRERRESEEESATLTRCNILHCVMQSFRSSGAASIATFFSCVCVRKRE